MSWVESMNSFFGAAVPPGTVQPMYGVPVTVGPPIVKYGPPPSPVPYVPGTGNAMPGFDWSSITAPAWQPSFSLPDFSHWGLSFPKLMAAVAFTAYLALIAVAIFGLAVRGAWYMKKMR